MMTAIRLMMVLGVVVGLMACGGATDQPAAPAPTDEASATKPTPVFEDDFEAGETEGWAGDEAAEDEVPAPDVPEAQE